jgi:hypothetical protein
MIEGKDVKLFPAWAWHRYTMQMGQHWVTVRPAHPLGLLGGLLEKAVKLDGCRHRRSTTMPGDDQGPAAIAAGSAFFVILAPKPPAQKTGHKGVTGPEHIEHFNLNAGKSRCLINRGRNFTFDDRATEDPALDDQSRFGHLAHRSQCRDEVLFAARYLEFFDGPNYQIKERQDAL